MAATNIVVVVITNNLVIPLRFVKTGVNEQTNINTSRLTDVRPRILSIKAVEEKSFSLSLSFSLPVISIYCHHAFGMAFISLARPPCHCHSHYAFCMISF